MSQVSVGHIFAYADSLYRWNKMSSLREKRSSILPIIAPWFTAECVRILYTDDRIASGKRGGTCVSMRMDYTGNGGKWCGKKLSLADKLDERGASGITALMRCVCSEGYGAVAALLKLGADVNSVDNNGWTTLIHASVHADIHMMRLLLDNGADPNAQTLRNNATAITKCLSRSGGWKKISLPL